VLVTKCWRPLFTDTMLTFAETTMRALCAELDIELVEFNAQTDHLHLHVAYPPTLTISLLDPRSKGPTAHPVRPEFTSESVRARTPGHL
jgi:putative transposase